MDGKIQCYSSGYDVRESSQRNEAVWIGLDSCKKMSLSGQSVVSRG